MEFVKKYQYTLVLFLISGVIFVSGVLPYGGSLFHLYAAPSQYERVTGLVLSTQEKTTTTNQLMYEVSVVFSLFHEELGEWEEYISLFDSPLSSLEAGMEISFLCSLENPAIVFQEWYVWRQFFIFLGFSLMGFFTGLMMIQPTTVVSKARKPRTLRERLEQY